MQDARHVNVPGAYDVCASDAHQARDSRELADAGPREWVPHCRARWGNEGHLLQEEERWASPDTATRWQLRSNRYGAYECTLPYHTAQPTHYRHRDAAGATRAQQSHRLSNSVMLHPQEMASASLRPRHACRTGCAMTQVCSRIRVRRRKPPVLRCARKTQTAQASCKTAPT